MSGAKHIDDDYDLDPEARYCIFGEFDESRYNDDLERFPAYFDLNGWPLYGEYDAYALKHPITQLDWHIAPRIPTHADTAEYSNWFSIANTFIDERHLILREVLQKTKTNRNKSAPTGELILGRRPPESGTALEGNLHYLKTYLIPHLEPMIAKREATATFACLWGEFCTVLSALPATVSFLERQAERRELEREKIEEGARQAEIRTKRAQGGAADNRAAQRKWYLHCRRKYCEELGITVQAFHRSIEQVICKIARGDLVPPAGWEQDWFQAICIFDERDGRRVYRHGFTDALKKASSHQDKNELLAQAPDMSPKIPPTDFSLYGVGV